MDTQQVLDEHATLIGEVEAVLAQEGQVLREGQWPEAALLERKRGLIERFETLLEAYKSAVPAAEAPASALKAQRAQLKNRLLKLFLIDRENQRLLQGLGDASGRAPARGSRSVSLESVEAAYQQRLRQP